MKLNIYKTLLSIPIKQKHAKHNSKMLDLMQQVIWFYVKDFLSIHMKVWLIFFFCFSIQLSLSIFFLCLSSIFIMTILQGGSLGPPMIHVSDQISKIVVISHHHHVVLSFSPEFLRQWGCKICLRWWLGRQDGLQV